MMRIIKPFRLALPVAFLSAVTIAGITAASAGDSEARLRAELAAAGLAADISGQADFRQRPGRRKFSVEIEGFDPNTMMDVEVANVVVGTITVDALGVGGLDFDDTAAAGDLDSPFPANFPALNGGELVKVGPLDGNLQPK
jgi:hypothetical protein